MVTLQLGADTRVAEYLALLIESNPNAARSLQTSMATITSAQSYQNKRKFKKVGKGVYEIKVPGVRVYCFKDEVEGLPAKLIIATNGGTKNKKKEQQGDIARAEELRERYLSAKAEEGTPFNYIKLDHED